jgi:hypothetical protein
MIKRNQEPSEDEIAEGGYTSADTTF